jgi:hypothetical protein
MGELRELSKRFNPFISLITSASLIVMVAIHMDFGRMELFTVLLMIAILALHRVVVGAEKEGELEGRIARKGIPPSVARALMAQGWSPPGA